MTIMTGLTSLPTTPGYHDIHAKLCELTVAMTLHLPLTPRGAPLVLVLHYGGQPSGYYGRGLLEQLIVPAWEALGAVFVAPVSQGGDWQSAANGLAIRAVLRLIELHYATNPDSCYLTGYSLGGIGCWHLLSQTDVRLAAVVPIAAPIPAHLPAVTTPTYVLHSDSDQLFPSGPVRARLDALRDQNLPIDYEVLEGLDHYNVGGYRSALQRLTQWLPAATKAGKP